MSEPLWINKEDVYKIHTEQLAEHGGFPGVRDKGLVESSLSRPQNLFFYQKPSLFDLAAAYAYGIIKNHPFLDGNKRTSFVISVLFLRLNGYGLFTTSLDKITTFLNLADGSISEKEMSQWFKEKSRPISESLNFL